MGHPDHDFLYAPFPDRADQVVQDRNQRLATLQREPFLADKLCVEVALQSFRAVQAGVNPAAFLSAKVAGGSILFEPLAQPEPLPGTGDMGELHGNPPAIDAFQHVENIPELHP